MNEDSMQDYKYIADLVTAVPEVPSDSIVSRTILKNEHVNTILFGFAAGQTLSEHTASQAAILHFLSGKARLTLGPDEMAAEKGSWVYMPPHLPHSILAETPVTMLLMMVK